jgi:7-keto-8-aminopelargonate synthetase-like enzyme
MYACCCGFVCVQVIIIVEGIYSMEGETTLLKELVELKKKYK